MLSHLNILAIFIALNVTGLADDTKKDDKKIYSGKKLKALLITGGCCHNYVFQSTALTSGIEEKVNVEFTVVNEGGTGTKAQIPLYDDPDWAKPYDVIVHNECFANTVDPEYIKKITSRFLLQRIWKQKWEKEIRINSGYVLIYDDNKQ